MNAVTQSVKAPNPATIPATRKSNPVKQLLKNIAQNIITYIFLAIFALLVLLPILWAFMSSFKTQAEMKNAFSFPRSFYFQNYINAWNASHMGSYFINSVMITVVSMAILIVLAVPTAYVLTRYQFKFRGVLKLIIMLGLFINVNYIVYPIYLMINDIGKAVVGNGLALTDNLFTVMLINAVTSVPFSIYLLSGYLSTLPKGYEEAAKIDGCGQVGTLVRIIVPLSLPSILTVVLFQFLAYWNEYLVAQTFLISDAHKTLPVGLLSIMQQAKVATDYGRMYAGLIIVMLPVLIVYCFVQKYLTKGMSIGGMKG